MFRVEQGLGDFEQFPLLEADMIVQQGGECRDGRCIRRADRQAAVQLAETGMFVERAGDEFILAERCQLRQQARFFVLKVRLQRLREVFGDCSGGLLDGLRRA